MIAVAFLFIQRYLFTALYSQYWRSEPCFSGSSHWQLFSLPQLPNLFENDQNQSHADGKSYERS
ncbi:hypothetical protein [Pectobacterium versatile]|uniref:hypothetical protein n=1 Tax=Pectobacterium versatile TaxID=2488639 RepID=UPI001375A020|nr:hypothetical protein [Pectobacterium versatile]MBN3196789.1 hypothetical protein [Pectobacterium versatile]